MANESNAGNIRGDDPALDTPPQTDRPALPPPRTSPPEPIGPSFGQRVGRFFRFLFRFVVLVVLLSLLSLALYLAIPWFYDAFVRPLERNTIEVRQLQSWQEQTQQDMADLQTKLGTLETVQNEQDQTLTDLDERMSDIETEIAARSESLAALERLQSELEAQNQQVSAELERQINLLKAMELMSRARLSMYQSNFGLARQDVQVARDLLAGIEPGEPGPLAKDLKAVLERLDMSLANLPAFPVAASDDLDIAWQILLAGLPEGAPTSTNTPTAVGTVSPAPTAADMTGTPTPPATARPSATP